MTSTLESLSAGARGRCKIATFYSRPAEGPGPTALVQFAWSVAEQGLRVLVLDWNLQEPALHRCFGQFLVDPQLAETAGLIEVLWRRVTALVGVSRGEDRPLAQELVDAARRLDTTFAVGGHIDFLGAGCLDSIYDHRVAAFHWASYIERGGAQELATLREQLAAEYDWVLINHGRLEPDVAAMILRG